MKTIQALRYILLGGAAALTLAACDRNKDASTDPAVSTAIADGPLGYESNTAYSKVSLKLPEAIKAYPELYKQLYDTEVGALKDYTEGAQSDRSEFGSADLPPYEKYIEYGNPVETGRLFSLIRTDFDYSGGAHPNTMAQGVLWDRTTKKQISAREMFAADADTAMIDRLLCNAVMEAKKGRPGSIALSGAGTWTCPDSSKTQIALAAGDTSGKASGITFLLNAYDVGPYSEGAYYLTIPFEVLGKTLNPTYAAEFAGAGIKGDVTNKLRPVQAD